MVLEENCLFLFMLSLLKESLEFFCADNCIAISTSSSPLKAYHRYAFIAQKIDPTLFKIKNNKTKTTVFPDYPKYGVWGDSYVLTTRDIKPDDRRQIGISVYVGLGWVLQPLS